MLGYKLEARVRRDKNETPSEEKPSFLHIDEETYKELLRHTALTVVSTAAVLTALGTTREVIVNITNPANY